MTDLPQTLTAQHAVITGASRGIGAAIAVMLARAGANVSLLGRDEAKLAEVSAQIGTSSRSQPITVDVAKTESIRAAFGAARERFGPIQILVNNAGQATSAKLADINDELWARILTVNVTGVFVCTREAMPDMVKAGSGRVVNIASTAGLRGGAYLSAYSASKHAVVGMTKSLALEFARTAITVNAVCPGYVDTEIVTQAIERIMAKTGRTREQALDTLLATNPQRRLITPEEVAHTVLWLCSPGTESITGQSIVLSGGEVT